MVGLAIPLAVSLSASTSVVEIAVWGAATVAVQLLMLVSAQLQIFLCLNL
jgi:putative membrane protein